MRKRLFSFLLSAVLIIGNIVPVMAAPEYTKEDVEVERPTDEIIRKYVELTDEEISEYMEEHAAEDEEAVGSAAYDSNWDSYASYYVYNQLTDKKRKVWDTWKQECNTYLYGSKRSSDIPAASGQYSNGEKFYYFAMCTAESGTFSSYDEFQKLYYIFRYSNPQFYFLYSGCVGNESAMRLAPMVYGNFVSGTNRSKATTAMNTSIQEYYSAAGSATGEALIKILHDRLTEEVTYNHDSINTRHVNEYKEFTQSAYSALVLKKPVCAGYTLAYEMLCNGKNIECIGVTSSDHAWNKVWTEGSWYNIDTTWDDQDNSGNIYYGYYLKSTARYRDTSDSYYLSHIEESYWDSYVPSCLHDSAANGWTYGGVDSAKERAFKPVITINNGKATITSSGSDRIFYSVNDEWNPSAGSSKSYIYKSAFSVKEGDVVKAIAVRDGYNNSIVAVKSSNGVTINYQLDGGTNNSGNISNYDPQEGGTFTLLAPTKKGYNFLGWYTTSTFDSSSKITVLDLTKEDGYTLYARWEAKSMTVTLDANGGSFSDEAKTKQKAVKYASAYGELDTPTKSGSEFLGWSKVKNGTSYVTSTSIVDEEENFTLYASWERKKYTINYHKNFGADEADSVPAYCDEQVTIKECEYTRKGYEFKEWNTKSDGKGTAYTPGETVDALSGEKDKTIDLYAIWEAEQYTVTFDADGGHFADDVPTTTKTVTYELTYGELPTPERVGYKFDGWSRTKGGTVNVYEETIVTIDNDHTLYAVWTAGKYKVKYNPNGGVGTEKEQEVAYDEQFKLEKSTLFINRGYDFKEWNTKANGTGDGYAPGTELSQLCAEDGGEVIFYAIWTEKTYTLSLNANGGVFDSGKVTEKMDVKFGLEIGEITNVPSRQGYEFVGWFKEKNCENEVTSATIYNGDLAESGIIYAGWSANSYTAFLDADGGVFDDGETEKAIGVTYDEKYGELPSPKREGYIFAGWYTESEGGSKITAQSTVKQTSDITLYARWKEVDEETVIVKQKVDIRDRFSVSANFVKYKVSNSKVASVSKYGVLTAKKAGTVKVTGLVLEDNEYVPVDTISVDIEKPVFKFTSAAVTPGQEIDANEFITGTDVVPDKWTLSNEKYAEIDEDGNILINDSLKSGTVKVTAWYSSEKNVAKYTATLKVKIPKLSFSKATIKEGTTKKLKVKNSLGAVVEFSSDDETVATIDDRGIITPVGIGTTVINATINDYTYTCEVTVIHNIKKLKLVADTTKLSLDDGDIAIVDIITTPGFDDIDADDAEWSTSNPSIATVEDGVVTPHNRGKVKITAKIMGKKATIKITVTN